MKRFYPAAAVLGGAVTAIALAAVMAAPAQAAAHQAGAAATGWKVAFSDQYGSAANSAAYYAVVAPSSTDAWAFGATNGESGPPAAAQFTGGTWQQSTLPSGLTDSYIEAASASAASNVWAITDGNALDALQWNGTQWSVAHTWNLPGAQITGVTALSPTDVWVFGAGGATGGIGTWHFNGSTWSQDTGAAGIRNASALSSSNIWAVGSNGVSPDNRIAHYTGGAWHVLSSPVFDKAQLNDVLALSAKQVWAVGAQSGEQSAPGLLAEYNGTAWSSVSVPYKAQLSRIASDGAGGFWVIAQPAGSSATWLLHRSSAGTWSKTVLSPAGSAAFGLSLVAGTTSMLGAGTVATTTGTSATVFLDGTLGS
jgi:hypothetical protein